MLRCATGDFYISWVFPEGVGSTVLGYGQKFATLWFTVTTRRLLGPTLQPCSPFMSLSRTPGCQLKSRGIRADLSCFQFPSANLSERFENSSWTCFPIRDSILGETSRGLSRIGGVTPSLLPHPDFSMAETGS